MGQNNGDSSQELTVDSAAQVLEGLLSDDESTEEQQPEKTTPEPEDTPEATVSDDDEVDTALSSEEESEETDEEPEQEVPAPKTFKVKVDGQDVEVPEDELVKGYSRHADYTRKTQQLSEKARAFEAEQTAVRAERQHNATRLAELDHTLTSLVAEPDWDQLQRENPDQFPQVHAAWQVHEKRLNGIRAERTRIEQQMQADAAKDYQRHIEAEQTKLAAAIPEWKDADVSKKDMAALVEYATGNGFTHDELNQVADHRAIILLRKAMMYDQSQKAKAAAAKDAQAKIEKVKVAAPGPSGSTKPKGTELSRRKQRLTNSGSVADAAAALELMLG